MVEGQEPLAMVPRARAIRGIRQWIESGALGCGETLPSERALAVKLGVGRATVRRALEVLQGEGLIVDRGGHVRTVMPAVQERLMGRTVVVALPAEGGMDERMGAMEAAGEAGVHAWMIDSAAMTPEAMQRLVGERPMGMVTAEGEWAEMAARAGIAVVVYGEGTVGFDGVGSDDEGGMYELTKWVIGRGKRRVLTLWSGSTQEGWVRGRLRGYEKAMREAGLEAMEAVEMPRVQTSGERQFEAASRLAAGYLAQYLNGANPVDAIMAGSDGEAAAIGGACRILGREVMVVGYGNEGGSVEDGENPMAATVDRKRVEMGRELVKLLMERIGGKLPREGQRRVIKPEVVVLEEAGKGEEKPTQPQVEPPVLMSVLQQEREGESKPLFGWKMEGGRWMLGKKGGGKK